ncbi:hypothetical protein [Methanobrevibacter sp.]|uniref:hypothetical protein n=1 Tax=Methanobrevibacter sp. TaxID=66852 RepID=UPI0025E4DA10|nr:hypothetical protein [Methanobrevibacter sp.]MBR4446863.1 hypothetical protein [Methanobrevibacter sp.]
MNKSIIVIIIILLAILSLVLVYSFDEGDDSNKTSLTVSSEGPIPLSSIIQDIKTGDYYKGYDNETLVWMESLGNKQVFVAADAFVVMDSWDAKKIPSQYVCDAYIDEFIECKVLENHSIGDVEYPKDVLLVKDVDYLGQEVHDLQGS